MIEFNGVDESTYGLTVKNIKKSLMPTIENRFVRKTAGDGSFNFGSYFGNYEITIEFQDKVSQTRLELYQNMLNINAWLYPLDKQSKILTLTGECGEGGLYHIAKVDGATELETILEYGKFEVMFVCADPYKKGASKGFFPDVNFSRTSTAFKIDTLLDINIVRFFLAGANYGVMIEDGVTNFVFNSLFATPTANIPSQYSARILNATGTHNTTAGVYTSTMATSTANGAYFGIYEPGGSQHLIANITDRISGGVYARVVSGNVLAQMRWNYLDTGFAGLPALTITTASTTKIRMVLENQNQPTQRVIGMDLTALAVTLGDTGVVEFSKPMLEIGTFSHTFQYQTTPRTPENLRIAIVGSPTNPFALALTIFPNYERFDLESQFDRVVVSLWQDATNNINILYNSNFHRFEAVVRIANVTVTKSVLSTSYVEGDQIKLYLLKEATQFKLFMRINADPIIDSGYVADARPNPVINTIFIGSENNTKYVNAIVKDLLFDDENLPIPLNYL